MAYTAPGNFENAKRSVGIVFKEPDSPRFELSVRASVRPPAVALPGEIVFGQVLAGGHAECRLELLNFSDEVWGVLQASCPIPWVRMSVLGLDTGNASAPVEPRQRAMLKVALDASNIAAGDYDDAIDIGPLGRARRSLRVPIRVRVRAPVAAVPGHVFFGTLRPGASRTKVVTVRFASGLPGGVARTCG